MLRQDEFYFKTSTFWLIFNASLFGLMLHNKLSVWECFWDVE